MRSGAKRALWLACAAGSLADGLCVAVIASRAAPHVRSLALRLGLALAFFLVPHALAALGRLVRSLRSRLRGWDATGILVVGFFLRAGFVLLLALAQTLILLCVVAFAAGCLSAVGGLAADSLGSRLAAQDRRRRLLALLRTASAGLGALGLVGTVQLLQHGHSQACFYAGAILFFVAALVGSGVGRVEE